MSDNDAARTHREHVLKGSDPRKPVIMRVYGLFSPRKRDANLDFF